MPNKQHYEDYVSSPPETLIKQAQPILQMIAMACGILVWCYSTFALRETVNELKNAISGVEIRCQNYSDNNRHRMEERYDAVLTDIRDQLSYLRNVMTKHKND